MEKEKFACQKYCAHCCTRNVTITTLEGYNILKHLDTATQTELMKKIQRQAEKKHFIPKVTINRMADLCAKDQELPEEENNENWGECPVLDEKLCPVYLQRPFACRCMLSIQNCATNGFADVPSWVISVNNVMLQYIEHIDAQGFSGNFTDIMLFLNDPQNYQPYENDRLTDPPQTLLANQPVYVLMVPPEDRTRIEPLMHAIRNIRID
jgi:Fe-S-cluster containining protein